VAEESPQEYVDRLLAEATPFVVRPGQYARGEQHPRARLCAEQVFEIRRRADDGESSRSLAREFQVGSATVSAIRRRVTWRHLIEQSAASAAAETPQEVRR
jgi:hypothetical protein